MTIHPISNGNRHLFEPLFADYFAELDAGIPDHIIRGKLTDLIIRQHLEGTLTAEMAMLEETPIGFAIYQVDSDKSDWCKRPGWGFIREFYMAPPYRKHGFGKFLAEHCQTQLRILGAEQLYLTSDTAIPFWHNCGWRLTEERCSNGQYILEK